MSQHIFNEYPKGNTVAFWISIAIGAALLVCIIVLFVKYTAITFWYEMKKLSASGFSQNRSGQLLYKLSLFCYSPVSIYPAFSVPWWYTLAVNFIGCHKQFLCNLMRTHLAPVLETTMNFWSVAHAIAVVAASDTRPLDVSNSFFWHPVRTAITSNPAAIPRNFAPEIRFSLIIVEKLL